ncbi:MAG: general secretion pathway protein GspB, partial [Wenzhouxiangellaceae bacterium]|nr:general secretion pathway protein GspB [Wenzhouxiangellaceae bacterium]
APEPAPEPAPESAPESAPEAAAAGPSAATSPGDGLVNYVHPWELPQAQRAKLPKLNLTVHYYASEPADRFVLINGERYREGDRVQGGVKVHEIRRNGVLVEFGDYLVLIE